MLLPIHHIRHRRKNLTFNVQPMSLLRLALRARQSTRLSIRQRSLNQSAFILLRERNILQIQPDSKTQPHTIGNFLQRRPIAQAHSNAVTTTCLPPHLSRERPATKSPSNRTRYNQNALKAITVTATRLQTLSSKAVHAIEK